MSPSKHCAHPHIFLHRASSYSHRSTLACRGLFFAAIQLLQMARGSSEQHAPHEQQYLIIQIEAKWLSCLDCILSSHLLLYLLSFCLPFLSVHSFVCLSPLFISRVHVVHFLVSVSFSFFLLFRCVHSFKRCWVRRQPLSACGCVGGITEGCGGRPQTLIGQVEHRRVSPAVKT